MAQTKQAKTQTAQVHLEPNFQAKKVLPTWCATCFLLAGMLLVGILRYRLVGIALERDEGGFAYIAQQCMNSGAKLYLDLIDNKLPGLYAIYALFLKLFGQSAKGIHLGLLVFSITSIGLFYQLACRFMQREAAALAATAFGLYAMSSNVFGFAAHATQILLPFMLGGFFLLITGLDHGRFRNIFLAGLCIGFGLIIKQQLALVALFGAVFLLMRIRSLQKKQETQLTSLKSLVSYAFGLALPIAGVMVYFAVNQRFSQFWAQAVTIPGLQAKASGAARFNATFFKEVVHGFELYWMIAIVALFYLFTKPGKTQSGFLIGFFLSSLISVGLGLGAYHHYYVLALPALALLLGYSIDKWMERSQYLAFGVGALLVLSPMAFESDYFFRPDFTAIHRKAYGMNPFPEMQDIARQLRGQLGQNASVGILGSEPELPFYLNTPPASRHLFMFPLLQSTDWSKTMQDEYLADLQRTKPEFLLWVTMTGSWAPEYYKTPFFRSTKPIVDGFYTPFGKCEIFENHQPSIIVWGEAAQKYQFKGNYQIYIYRRKS